MPGKDPDDGKEPDADEEPGYEQHENSDYMYLNEVYKTEIKTAFINSEYCRDPDIDPSDILLSPYGPYRGNIFVDITPLTYGHPNDDEVFIFVCGKYMLREQCDASETYVYFNEPQDGSRIYLLETAYERGYVTVNDLLDFSERSRYVHMYVAGFDEEMSDAIYKAYIDFKYGCVPEYTKERVSVVDCGVYDGQGVLLISDHGMADTATRTITIGGVDLGTYGKHGAFGFYVYDAGADASELRLTALGDAYFAGEFSKARLEDLREHMNEYYRIEGEDDIEKSFAIYNDYIYETHGNYYNSLTSIDMYSRGTFGGNTVLEIYDGSLLAGQAVWSLYINDKYLGTYASGNWLVMLYRPDAPEGERFVSLSYAYDNGYISDEAIDELARQV